jgi:hypothetical protein
MQVFLGVRSGYTLAIPLKSKAYAYTALQDYIRTVGAPLFLISDSAKEEYLGEWITICHTFGIPKRSSEPYYQHQNKVERRIQDIKRRTLYTMHIHSVLERFWDYVAEYVTELINHTAFHHNNWRTPYETLHGDTPDTSIFCFHFYEPMLTSTRLPLFPIQTCYLADSLALHALQGTALLF